MPVDLFLAEAERPPDAQILGHQIVQSVLPEPLRLNLRNLVVVGRHGIISR